MPGIVVDEMGSLAAVGFLHAQVLIVDQVVGIETTGNGVGHATACVIAVGVGAIGDEVTRRIIEVVSVDVAGDAGQAVTAGRVAEGAVDALQDGDGAVAVGVVTEVLGLVYVAELKGSG